MLNIVIKVGALVVCVGLFGLLALYSNKIINNIVTSRDFVNKWYYKLFGQALRNTQERFSRTAQLNKGTFIYSVYHFFDDIIINLDMKKDNVTVTGLLVFVSSLSIILSVVLISLMKSIGLILPLFAAIFYLIVVVLRFIGLTQYEKKESEIMDAVDLLVSDIRGGIFNAIIKYKDSFSPNLRPYFSDFVDDIQNKGYSFKQAMAILNEKLGYNFNDFAQKAIIYEEKADNTMEDIFSTIVETNRQRRTLRDINNKKFTELRTQFIVSFILIIGYAFFSTLFDPFIFQFITTNAFGKIMLIADIVVVAFVLSYLVSIKSKSL